MSSLIQDFHCFLLFRYEVFTGRVLLAALDHNFDVVCKTLEWQFKKIYSKRSGNWMVEAVKEPKQYEYFALLQADILRCQAEDTEPVTRHIEVSPLKSHSSCTKYRNETTPSH